MFRTIAIISAFSILIPLVSVLVFRRRFEGYYPILIFVVASTCFEMAFFATSSYKINNIPLLHLYTLFEFTCLSFFFRAILGKRMIPVVVVLFIMFSTYLVINPFLFETWYTYNSISRSLESILLTVFCILYFYRIYTEELVMILEEQPQFWIVTGLAIYLTVGLFSHLLADYILKGSVDKDTLMTSYAFVQVSNIIKNGLISWGVWKVNH